MKSLPFCPRFSLVKRVGTPCTAIAFTLHQNNEVLIALSDYSLRCYNTGLLNSFLTSSSSSILVLTVVRFLHGAFDTYFMQYMASNRGNFSCHVMLTNF